LNIDCSHCFFVANTPLIIKYCCEKTVCFFSNRPVCNLRICEIFAL